MSNMRKIDAGMMSLSKMHGGKADAGATNRSRPSLYSYYVKGSSHFIEDNVKSSRKMTS